MARARATTPRRRRRRERLYTLGAFALAAVAGLIAAHFGTPRAWEGSAATTPTSASTHPNTSISPLRIP